MSTPLHLILGDGIIGLAAADELNRRGLPVVLGSRSAPEATSYAHRAIDALDANVLLRATTDVSHLYVTLGLKYDARVWARDWPRIIDNVISAARINGFRIVMFDNVYPYGPTPLQVPMQEDHPQQPPSMKGKIRKAMDERLLRAVKEDGLRVVIARCADFYGPLVRNSSLYVSAIERQLEGKSANWLGDVDRLHSFAYSLDAARGLVELALDDVAYGETWHLPTAEPTPTPRQLLSASAKLLGAPTTIRTMPRWMIALMATFAPILKELREMLYQNEQDYVFSSAKFLARYPHFRVTPYEEGIAKTVEAEVNARRSRSAVGSR
jgi:nucleoside-diphosphate-sugar epimerase